MATVDEILAELKNDMVNGMVKVGKVDPATITDDVLKAQIAKGWFVKGENKLVCVHCGTGVASKENKPRHATCVGCDAVLTA